MSEDYLVRYCAPTLAGIKTGSLFCCAYTSEEELRGNIRTLNRKLGSKGLRVLPLRLNGEKALMYVYRPSILKRDLTDKTAAKLLEEHGYTTGSCESCIVQLIQRIRKLSDFPHEIGLFLGYPPEDVAGFIDNKAEGCKCVGCWKVYGDEESAKKRFAQYKKCNRIYMQCWQSGSNLDRLTVAK